MVTTPYLLFLMASTMVGSVNGLEGGNVHMLYGNALFLQNCGSAHGFLAQLYYNCKAAGQEPKLLNDEQISSVLEAFQTYRQK